MRSGQHCCYFAFSQFTHKYLSFLYRDVFIVNEKGRRYQDAVYGVVELSGTTNTCGSDKKIDNQSCTNNWLLIY